MKGEAVETAALMETVEKTVKGRDFFLDVFSTSFHSAWKTRRSIRKSLVGERRRVSHSSHSPYCYYPHISSRNRRETGRQLVSANLVLYEIHKPDISLATKSGHFNLLRTACAFYRLDGKRWCIRKRLPVE